MVLFFFIIVIISMLIIIGSSFKLSIDNLLINTKNKILDYDFRFGLYFMKKIKIIGIRINKKRVERIKKILQNLDNSKILKKINNIYIRKLSLDFQEKMQKEIKNNNINVLKILNVIIKNFRLETLEFRMNLNIGLEEAYVTSILIGILSTVIPIILNFTITNIKERNKYCYKIIPIYEKSNIFELHLNCIINLKLVHIINIIYKISKEGRSDKYVRASNRRSYGYCHE